MAMPNYIETFAKGDGTVKYYWTNKNYSSPKTMQAGRPTDDPKPSQFEITTIKGNAVFIATVNKKYLQWDGSGCVTESEIPTSKAWNTIDVATQKHLKFYYASVDNYNDFTLQAYDSAGKYLSVFTSQALPPYFYYINAIKLQSDEFCVFTKKTKIT
jgi:hypothetical protein